MHPVIVGKRALPAIGLAPEGGALDRQAELLIEPDDIVIGFGTDEGGSETAVALAAAESRGCLTIAFSPAGAECELQPSSDDAFVRQELIETLYHVLWELVHVFFEHRGLLEGRSDEPVHDTGASSFLYPFLGEQEHDLERVIADVRSSVVMKAEEVGSLREQTLTECREELPAAATTMRRAFDAGRQAAGARQRRFRHGRDGCGGRLRHPPRDWPARPALDLTEDSAILTAIANDIGPAAIFQRQIIAYGRDRDVLLALSTSGNSENVIAALAEARRRKLATIAMVGYDGGRIAGEHLADHVIVTRSQHIPRIQEAQASAYHVLRELVELVEHPGQESA